MTLLLAYFFLALFLSFLCSLLEAVLLSTPASYSSILSKQNASQGDRLERFKENINRPLAAILTLNTFAHTLGAAGVGAQTLELYGESSVAVASGILTLLILVFSEIIPKTIGSVYWRGLIGNTTLIIEVLIFFTYPLVLLAEYISNFGEDEATVTREEVIAMAEMGEDEGVLEEQETDIIENTLKLKDVKVKDIMTPRSVIFAVNSDFTVGQVLEEHETLDFTRIPIFEGNLDAIKGMVNRYEIINRKAEDQFSTRMHEISQEVPFVNENDPIDKVLELFIKNRDHMALVKDNDHILTGLITLEDAIETILGQEIVDEHDSVVDMRDLAESKEQE
ncbi:CNNM domain-containing protein [Candidatus Marinimicrobia bacterium]|nr:CNNM domain-containing protein [Candidatus Neomarinimicrobiota bacterium]MDA9736019.1 CNNM domain-containing protein [Candidatus Neomarinimicrobiota bacterium]|tara:strand:- start:331 stop:1338 length:1008 start_codon:yes stop_codon:yes gene_type:complete